MGEVRSATTDRHGKWFGAEAVVDAQDGGVEALKQENECLFAALTGITHISPDRKDTVKGHCSTNLPRQNLEQRQVYSVPSAHSNAAQELNPSNCSNLAASRGVR